MVRTIGSLDHELSKPDRHKNKSNALSPPLTTFSDSGYPLVEDRYTDIERPVLSTIQIQIDMRRVVTVTRGVRA